MIIVACRSSRHTSRPVAANDDGNIALRASTNLPWTNEIAGLKGVVQGSGEVDQSVVQLLLCSVTELEVGEVACWICSFEAAHATLLRPLLDNKPTSEICEAKAEGGVPGQGWVMMKHGPSRRSRSCCM